MAVSFKKELLKKIISERWELILRLSEKEVILPTPEDAVEANRMIMEACGGVHGVRDGNLLESAFAAVYNEAVRRKEKNPTILAFTLLERIVKNRPFVDGNEATAVAVCELTLKLNSVDNLPTNDFYYSCVLGATKGENFKLEKVVEALGKSR